jgi:hypothetical protein
MGVDGIRGRSDTLAHPAGADLDQASYTPRRVAGASMDT